jgi:hypothetical protein
MTEGCVMERGRLPGSSGLDDAPDLGARRESYAQASKDLEVGPRNGLSLALTTHWSLRAMAKERGHPTPR